MKKIVLTNIVSGILSQFVTIIYGLIIPILLIRHFGSNVNGLVSSITQFIAYINLLQLGIGPIIKKSLFEPIANNDNKKIGDILGASNLFFKKIAYVLILYIIILCIIFPFINSEFSKIYSISLILIISLGTFFEYFFGITYRLYLSSSQKNYIVDFINIFGYIISIVLIYFLISIDSSIQIVKLIGSIIFIIKPLLMKLYFDRRFDIKINNKSQFKFKNKIDGLAHHIAATVQSNTDVVILTIFSSLKNISIYSVYNLIITGMQSIIISLTNGVDGYFGKLMINNNDIVNKKFNIYNFFYYTITTILIGCTMILIVPFVSIYTKGVTDANYIRPLFAYILVFAEFNYVIRYPYRTLVYSKGHFRQTTKYAILEPIFNIILSILFVNKYGLIGVAMGTLISTLIRSFGFIYHAIKYILKEKFYFHIKIILVSYLELVLIFIFKKNLIFLNINNYINWGLNAIIILLIITLVVTFINLLLFKNLFKLRGVKKSDKK